MPAHVRSDTGPGFAAEPGRPWGRGDVESFDGELRDERLNPERFDPLAEAKVPAERWRRSYDAVRRHGAPGDRPPAPEARPPRSDPAPGSVEANG